MQSRHRGSTNTSLFLWIRKDQSLQNEAVEAIPCSGIKKPAQVQAACSAYGDTPGEAGKPAKFGRRRSDGAAAFSPTEATDLVHIAVWVGKGVTMRALKSDPICRACNRAQTLTASNNRLGIGNIGRTFILGQPSGCAASCAVRNPPKQMLRKPFQRHHRLQP